MKTMEIITFIPSYFEKERFKEKPSPKEGSK